MALMCSYMKSCVNNSSYWSHPECVLITMLTDTEDPSLRLEALEIIKQCHCRAEEEPLAEGEVWEFLIKEVSWDCESYRDFLDGGTPITEPPVTLRLSIKEVEAMAADPSTLELEGIPCHTQSVERWGFFAHSSHKAYSPYPFCKHVNNSDECKI